MNLEKLKSKINEIIEIEAGNGRIAFIAFDPRKEEPLSFVVTSVRYFDEGRTDVIEKCGERLGQKAAEKCPEVVQ